MEIPQPTTSCCVTLVHHSLLWSPTLQSENSDGKQKVDMVPRLDLTGTQVHDPHSRRDKERGGFISLSRVTDILMEESQGHGVTPEMLPVWEADWIDRPGLRTLCPSLPTAKPSGQQTAYWTKGRQAAGRQGDPRAQGERNTLSAETQPRGLRPQCGGFFSKKQRCLSSTNCC